MISVLIATKDRNEDLSRCLKSILKNQYTDFEILVLDQSHSELSLCLIKKINNKKIRYYHIPKKGKSGALNYGIKEARGKILAFTDDDCIVSDNWLSTISSVFEQNKQIEMLFGKSLPYKKAAHKKLICPAVFSLNSSHIVSKPSHHAIDIGFGNNMALRKKLDQKDQFFNTWLGPGSIAYAAEDADIALRFLINKKKIKYDSRLLIFHNKWLTPKQNFYQSLRYLCGETACYGYYSFKGYEFAKLVIKNNFDDSFSKVKKLISKIVNLQKIDKRAISPYAIFLELIFRIRGLIIGFIFATKSKLNN